MLGMCLDPEVSDDYLPFRGIFNYCYRLYHIFETKMHYDNNKFDYSLLHLKMNSKLVIQRERILPAMV